MRRRGGGRTPRDAGRRLRPRHSVRFAEERPDVVQDQLWADESHAVDVADAVLAVEEEDLQDVPEEAAPPPVGEPELRDRLPEILEQRPEVRVAGGGEETPRRRSPIEGAHRRDAGGRVALGIEADRDEPGATPEHAIGGERAVEAGEHGVPERAAGDLDARRVDEGDHSYLATLQGEQRRPAAAVVEQRVIAYGLDDRQRVGPDQRRSVLRREGADGVRVPE